MTLVKRSVALAGHRTSVALEREFWEALERLAAARQQSVVSLMAQADATRDPSQGLASVLRVLALQGQGALPPGPPLG